MKDFKVKSSASCDVAGIGSALLDLIVSVEDSFLDGLGLKKANMHLVDAELSRKIQSMLGTREIEKVPGGSSANAMAGVALFGGKALFIGNVGNDRYGDIYLTETERSGVISKLTRSLSLTGHAITLITPDSERTFATHLGAALDLSESDIHIEDIKKSKILHIEGYLLEPENLRKACMKAFEFARSEGTLVSIDLSDPGLIARIKPVIEHVLKEYAHIVFANEQEAMAYTGLDAAASLDRFYEICPFAVVKTGASGSIIKHENRVYQIKPFPVKLVNTNGAGDIYAAGVLYGIARGYSPDVAGKLGSYAASIVVSNPGARIKDHFDADKISLL